MIGFTYKSQHFTLHVQPIIEQDSLRCLHVKLERNTATNGNATLAIEATIAARRLVDWIVTQILCATFLGPYPGVTILGPTVSTPPPP